MKRLARDSRGSVAILFGLLAAPLVGAAGLGVDYTRAVSYRIKLENAATAAALSAVETARTLTMTNPGLPEAEVLQVARERALRVFNARAPQAISSFFADSVNVGRVGETISASIAFSGSVETYVANILSIESIGVSGNSQLLRASDSRLGIRKF